MQLDEFKELLSTYTDSEAFLANLDEQQAIKTFRVNTLKTSVERFKELTDFTIESVKWNNTTFTSIDATGYSLEYFAGLVHFQALSSMLPPLSLAPTTSDKVLDLCAAPGSKTTQLAVLMENKSCIVAVDKGRRVPPLVSNLSRLGVLNVAVMRGDALHVRVGKFNKALADVPCTCLGTYGGWEDYKPEHLPSTVRLQENIALKAFDSLLPGGEMVYSTCTFLHEENEGVIQKILEKRSDAKLIDTGLKMSGLQNGLSDYGAEFKKCKRVWPQEFNSEGFFIAKLQKSE